MNDEGNRLTPAVAASDDQTSVHAQPPGPAQDAPVLAAPTAPDSAEAAPRPKVTFMGNSYDLTAVVAVTAGAMIAIPCLTCNMGYYCLPIVPIVLGLIGLLSAKDSVDAERTRLLSWLGIGGGLLVIELIVLLVVVYIGLISLSIMAGAVAQGQ